MDFLNIFAIIGRPYFHLKNDYYVVRGYRVERSGRSFGMGESFFKNWRLKEVGMKSSTVN